MQHIVVIGQSYKKWNLENANLTRNEPDANVRAIEFYKLLYIHWRSQPNRVFITNPEHPPCLPCLCNQSAGSGALVPPGWGQSTDGLVVSRQAVNSGLDENEAELRVLIFAIALEMLADSDGLKILELANWIRYWSRLK